MLGWPYFIWTIYHHQRNNRKTAEGNHKGNGGGTKVLQDKNIIFLYAASLVLNQAKNEEEKCPNSIKESGTSLNSQIDPFKSDNGLRLN